MKASGTALYVHIPYCIHKCPYCDFNTYAINRIPEKEYTSALLAEFDALAASEEWSDLSISTIYFGGGTPSLFSPDSIKALLKAFKERSLTTPKEITLEANPGALTFDYLAAVRALGVSRLSLGAQSFSQKSLTTLGRIHKPEDIEVSVSYAREAGFHNVNLDLMYGIPDQTLEDLANDLKEYLRLRPEHISPYGLTIEKGTPFYQRYKKGTLVLPEEDSLVAMMELVNSELKKQLYSRYEISNFAKSGFEAQHNIAYWEGSDYMGLGAGAHSFKASRPTDDNPVWGRRHANVADPENYMSKAMSTGSARAWEDLLSKSDSIFEMFFLGLRTKAGVSPEDFSERFDCTPFDVYPDLIANFEKDGLLEASSNSIALTEKGFMLADSIIEQFSDPRTPLKGKGSAPEPAAL
jgi:oxygen-independent coproporphyrinogen-3 oxidase